MQRNAVYACGSGCLKLILNVLQIVIFFCHIGIMQVHIFLSPGTKYFSLNQ